MRLTDEEQAQLESAAEASPCGYHMLKIDCWCSSAFSEIHPTVARAAIAELRQLRAIAEAASEARHVHDGECRLCVLIDRYFAPAPQPEKK